MMAAQRKAADITTLRPPHAFTALGTTKPERRMPKGCIAVLYPMMSGEIPSLSMMRERSGNMRPNAKPKTVIAAMAAKRLIQRWSGTGGLTDELAAGDGEANEKDRVDGGE